MVASKRCQNRLVSLDENTIPILSGVLSDSMALLTKVYEQQDAYRRTYGFKSLSSGQIADAIASACQQHAFGGGLRPYGSTFVIVENGSNIMTQTDPSGAVWHLKDEELYIVGGKEVGILRKKLLEEKPPTTLAQALEVTAKQLMQHEKESTWLEVMVLTKEKGAHRLTDEQVERLIARVRPEKENS